MNQNLEFIAESQISAEIALMLIQGRGHLTQKDIETLKAKRPDLVGETPFNDLTLWKKYRNSQSGKGVLIATFTGNPKILSEAAAKTNDIGLMAAAAGNPHLPAENMLALEQTKIKTIYVRLLENPACLKEILYRGINGTISQRAAIANREDLDDELAYKLATPHGDAHQILSMNPVVSIKVLRTLPVTGRTQAALWRVAAHRNLTVDQWKMLKTLANEWDQTVGALIDTIETL